MTPDQKRDFKTWLSRRNRRAARKKWDGLKPEQRAAERKRAWRTRRRNAREARATLRQPAAAQ